MKISNIKFTEEEDNFLKRYYIERGAKYCSQELNRTPHSIYHRVRNLKIQKLSSKVFAKEECEIIKKYYPKYGPTYCAQLLNRTTDSVERKASRLNIRKKCQFKEQIIYLANKYYSGKFEKLFNLDLKTLKSELMKSLDGQIILWTVNTIRITKYRAKKKGLKHNLDCDFLYSNLSEYCPIFNIKFEFYCGLHHPSCPSVDRINNKLGYIKSNISIISLKANFLKKSMSLNELENLINYLNVKDISSEFIPLNEQRKRKINKLYRHAKSRAKFKKLDFSLTKEYLYSIIPEFCLITKKEIDFSGKNRVNSPSIDRFDNSKGYTMDNVKIISHHGNLLKGSGILEEFKKIYQYMLSNNN